MDAVTRAAHALGLHHGPIHAECRVNADRRVFVLEVAARPIGGLCARALRFESAICHLPSAISLEELLLRHALGEAVACAAGGVRIRRDDDSDSASAACCRSVDGVDEARAPSTAIDEIHITAKPDQLLVPLPEGASYLGFIFARAATTRAVEPRCAARTRDWRSRSTPNCRC